MSVQFPKYPKMPNVYTFSPDTHKMTDFYSTSEIEALRGYQWCATEKIDGMNIRVMWDGYKVSFGGRTDNAQIPDELMKYLENHFWGPVNETFFETMFGDKPHILYGEGYGGKIQSGYKYSPTMKFILFDVLSVNTGYWYDRYSMYKVADKFQVDVVPLIMVDTLSRLITHVSNKPLSKVANEPMVMEGLVATPSLGLKDRYGNRIAVKIKVRDFAAGE